MRNAIQFVFLIFASCACNSTNNSANATDSSTNAIDSSHADHTNTALNKDTAGMTKTDVGKSDAAFATAAANGGMAEVAMGRLAEANAGSDRVKNFGAMMVKDHSEGDDKLKEIVRGKNISMPIGLKNEDQKHLDELGKKTGAEFDKMYMDMMLDDHKVDIQEFKKAANECKDTDLKNFAETTLPVLQKHLDSAKAITGKH